MRWLPAVLWASTPVLLAAPAAPRPHILFIVADDLGWHDVGFHGSEIKTPRLDALAKAGTELNQFYVQPVCSPTRAALMTGRYPIRYGFQVGVVRPWDKHGLPLEERTLAQALKQAGYKTAITGKWHLGHHERAYLPTRRGFDHQYGHYNGALDYFTHERNRGLDWQRDDQTLREEGYTTELIAREAVRLIGEHDPAQPLFLYVPFNAPHAVLQALPRYLDQYRHIQPPKRAKYAAMVTCLDDAVGHIVEALDNRGMRDNTLVFFSSDNGGELTVGGADNDPLRGAKGSVYEGGVRVPAFVCWPGKVRSGVNVDQPLHMVDWYPTLLRLAGATLHQPLPLDGLDVWPTIAEGKPTPHEEILHNVEPQGGALRRGDWKLVYRKAAQGRPENIELFNIPADPSEKHNLAGENPQKASELKERLEAYATQARPPVLDPGPRAPEGFEPPKVWVPVK
ncbi:MAG: arylsulfatase [Planctomycetes bacterium]|nr:arylsulfatase [Planctomycetota bacterium]